MSKKFWTLAIQYDVDGEPCDPPHHIEERLVTMMQIMHEIGFGMDVKYGFAQKEMMDIIQIGDEE